jgi:Nif-specific regulatory protein
MTSASDELQRLRWERDFFRHLLDLGMQTELGSLLDAALRLIVDLTSAERGYIEVADPALRDGARWSLSRGLSSEEIEQLCDRISRGVVAEALATGKTLSVPAAHLDPRFESRASVRAHRIEAVLCAPIGGPPPLGVVYLQGRTGAGPFTKVDREHVEVFARHLAPIAHILLREADRSPDPTATFRRLLRAESVVGRSAALASVLKQVALVAPLDVSVLLTGESGTGKSQIARVIHESGPRRGGPFVELNCGAVPESLLESELFGALPGAHSTASHRIVGKVAAADRGTLLLDEIADLPLSAQGKLLQLLQSREYYSLGASRPTRADVRIIAATNVDLSEAVSAKRFREDLFYRLHVVPIRLPTLRERRGDVPLLARHFVQVAEQRHGLPEIDVAPSALVAAEATEWRGNVRQLANALEAAVIRAAGEGAEWIERAHLFPDGSTAAPEGSASLQEATRRFQAQIVRQALESADWNISEVARRLDVGRSHLYTLIRALGIQRRE